MINEKPQRVRFISLGPGLFSTSFISIQLLPPASRVRLAAMMATATRGNAITEAGAIAGLINPTLCSLAITPLLRFSFDIKNLKLQPCAPYTTYTSMTTLIQIRSSPPNQNAEWEFRLRGSGQNKMMEAQDKTFLVGLSNDIFLSSDKHRLSLITQNAGQAKPEVFMQSSSSFFSMGSATGLSANFPPPQFLRQQRATEMITSATHGHACPLLLSSSVDSDNRNSSPLVDRLSL